MSGAPIVLPALRVFIRTYGCQMNERDSEAAMAKLIAAGCVPVSDESEADLLIFNTCSVRDLAERKAMGKVGIIKKSLKAANPDLIIGVMGCMAQSKGETLFETLPHLDFVLGTDQLHRLPALVADLLRARRPICLTASGGTEVLHAMSEHLTPESGKTRVSASVAVSRGCSRHCSYCIVPAVRGPEKSRDAHEIRAEVEALCAQGVKEILLLGQNVAAYGYDNKAPPMPDDFSPFADLLVDLSEIEGLKRIRFTSPHPAYYNEKLIQTLAALPKVCHAFHLPLQSGSDAVLKRMNRPYTQAQYLEIARKIKDAMPDALFSTDIIVGFPGETEADFEETCRVMREVAFDNAYIFKYSIRKNTRAAVMPDQVPQSIKEARNQVLLDILHETDARYNQTLVGQELEVLVESVSKRNDERYAARTSTNKVVIIPRAPGVHVGDLIPVRITRSTVSSLYGELV